MTTPNGWRIQTVAAVLCVLLLPVSTAFAQEVKAEVAFDTQQPGPQLAPDQLNTLVAPLALYPDPLLGQVLAASTYPLEIIEAQQWLQQHNNLQGTQLMDAARQETWDPSVQALVAFPDALKLLSSDIRWTTDLGNAFLAQQADVMSAIQVMRSRARANGRLTTNRQQVVTENTQGDQSAIEIQPAEPEVIYVPVYNPSYVWGPPSWGVYPNLWYGYGYGYGYGPSIYIGGFYPGWGGWGGWGWGYGWFGGGLYINTAFFGHYGYRGNYYGGYAGYYGGRNFVGGRGSWAHDSGHRGGVPYPNRTVATRFNSNSFVGSRTNGGQTGRTRDFNGSRTTNNFNGSRPTNNQAVGGNRTNAGRVNGGGSAVNQGGSTQTARGGTATGTNGTGFRSSNGDNRTATATNSFTGTNRQTSPNTGTRAPVASNRGSAVAPSNNRSFAPGNSAPRTQSSYAPRASASMAPRQSAPAPRSFASSPSNSGARASAAPRASGGGGFSGGRSSGGGGGRSSGGGGGGRSSGGGGGGGHRR